MIFKHLLTILTITSTTVAAGSDDVTQENKYVTEKNITPKSNLRGVISVAKGDPVGTVPRGGAFDSSCLHGRYSYSNFGETFASISVAVFDGKGKISEMDSIITNRAGPDGEGRQDISRPFISGSYEVHPNGRGVIDFILDVDGREAPNTMEFVVTQTLGGCEITAMDSFGSARSESRFVQNNLVAPKWSKIANS